MKDDRIYIRLGTEEKLLIKRAAFKDDLKPSTWIRRVALQEARKLVKSR